MTLSLKTALLAILTLTLTPCLEEPKQKKEVVSSSEQYEKIIDDIVGPGTVDIHAIKVGDKDTMVEEMNISNSLFRESFRRSIEVLSVKNEANQTEYRFQVKYVKRDQNGNPEPEVNFVRTLVAAVNSEGYINFAGDGNQYSVFSWDFLIGLRGFCSSFETNDFIYGLSCSNMQVEAATYGKTQVPVRKLSLNRTFTITDKKTGEVETGKLRYVIQIAPNVAEISKVVSYCVEGPQKVENNVYYLVNCRNIQSL